MSTQPTGTVTFLFTDIEGSTRLWEQDPPSMHLALARHDALLQSTIEYHGGYVFKRMGDALCAAFPTAPAALAAALAAQRAIHAQTWGTTGPIRVRMALHTGATVEYDGDYFGPVLNRVARLLSAGHGGQVLLSAATQELVVDAMLPGVSLRDLGRQRLRDLSRPERIYQLVAPDLPANFAMIKTLEGWRTNLPVQFTPLIGRDRELAQLCALLQHENVRLLTLTGPGGMGKTRLALALAAELLDEFDDGVFFVDLAPIRDPQLVVPAIAQTLGAKEPSHTSLLQVLKDELRPRRTLLLLDNFEQVVEAAPLVTELLQAAPGVRLLVTSRVVLRLRGEKEYRVPPLELPDRHEPPSIERLTQYEGVRLFFARARDVQPTFAVTNVTAPAILEICHRLDGLPLAIELAAARIRILPPEQLLERLDQRLQLLTGGARDLPQRHRTLRAAIDWSYQLLRPEEQQLFRTLGVFVGGCSLEAVEVVYQQKDDHELGVLEGLSVLCEQSLLRQEEVWIAETMESRFVLLETLREYAVEQLQLSGELPCARQAHLDYVARLVGAAEPELRGGHQQQWLDRLEHEHDNVRAALDYALEQAPSEVALRLTGVLGRFWYIRGHLSDGWRWLQAALARSSHSPTESRALALHSAGMICYAMGDITQGYELLHEHLQLRRAQENPDGIAMALNTLGWAAKAVGNFDQARSYIEESVALLRTLGGRHKLAIPLSNLGDLWVHYGDFARARQCLDESLALCRELDNTHGMATAQHSLGRLGIQEGKYAQARACIGESLVLYRELGNKEGLASGIDLAAMLAGVEGQLERAARLFGAAERLRQSIRSVVRPFMQLAYEGEVASVRELLDDTTFQTAWAEGRSKTMDAAITDALEWLKETG